MKKARWLAALIFVCVLSIGTESVAQPGKKAGTPQVGGGPMSGPASPGGGSGSLYIRCP